MTLDKTKHTQGQGWKPISQIQIQEKRERRPSQRLTKHLEDLSESIKEDGLIQPIVLHEDTLIAGWCRLQAFIKLGFDEIPFVERDTLGEGELQRLRLAENLWRLDPTWQEHVLEIAATHWHLMGIHHAEGEKWGLRETGKLLRTNRASLSDAITLAEAIEAGNEAVLTAPNATEAARRLTTARADEAAAKLATMSGAIPTAKQLAKTAPTAGGVKPKASSDGPLGAPMVQSSGIPLASLVQQAAAKAVDPDEAPAPSFTVPLRQLLQNDDCIKWFDQFGKNFFNMIYTDPPYGIEMDNLDYSSADIERVEEEHDVEYNLELLPAFLEKAYAGLKPGGYCLFWYDISHEEKIRGWCDKVGFGYQGWPIVWCKAHQCRNRNAGRHATKNIEYCFVAYKGQASLREKLPSSYFIADGSSERRQQKNPFAKPFSINQKLIQACTAPGDVIGEPFAGEGSIVRSIINCNRKPFGCELREHHYNRLLEKARTAYIALTNNKVVFE